jgi:hypothetical protein
VEAVTLLIIAIEFQEPVEESTMESDERVNDEYLDVSTVVAGVLAVRVRWSLFAVIKPPQCPFWTFAFE